MRWLNWLPGRRRSTDPNNWVSLDGLVAEGLRDLPSARRVIARLERERKALRRRQRKIVGQPSRQMQHRVKMIARSPGTSVDLEAFELSQAMREVGAASRVSSLRSEQTAAIEDRIQAIDHALSQLRAYVSAQENPSGPKQSP